MLAVETFSFSNRTQAFLHLSLEKRIDEKEFKKIMADDESVLSASPTL